MEPITKQKTVIDHAATGVAMRAQRRDAGLTMTLLAELMGKTQARLCGLENGRLNWTAETVKQYQDALAQFKANATAPAGDAPPVLVGEGQGSAGTEGLKNDLAGTRTQGEPAAAPTDAHVEHPASPVVAEKEVL